VLGAGAYAEAVPGAAEAVDERVGDALVDVGDLDGAAGLAGVGEGPLGDAGGGAGEVAVGEDDGHVLAAHLHAGDDPELGAAGAHAVAGGRRAGEDAGVDAALDEPAPDLAVAGEALDHAERELPGEVVDHPGARLRRVLRGL